MFNINVCAIIKLIKHKICHMCNRSMIKHKIICDMCESLTDQWLNTIFFAEYDVGLKKPIRSRYGMKMFHQCFRADGRTYNVSVLYILCFLRIISNILFFDQGIVLNPFNHSQFIQPFCIQLVVLTLKALN